MREGAWLTLLLFLRGRGGGGGVDSFSGVAAVSFTVVGVGPTSRRAVTGVPPFFGECVQETTHNIGILSRH